MSRDTEPEDTGDERDSVDLSAVQADDALLDALGGSDPKVADELGNAELNALLLSWSREVDSEPMPELVSVDTAVAAVNRASEIERRNRRGRRMRLLVPFAAAAAVLAVTFGGASVAAKDAQPGDTLWGLTKVLYTDRANSVEASHDVEAEFKIAREAIDDGNMSTARDALDKAETTLQDVREQEDRSGLSKQHDDLESQLPADDDDAAGGGTDDTSSATTSDSSTASESDSSSPSDSATTSPDETSDPSETTPPEETSTAEPDPSSSSSSPTSSDVTSESTGDSGARGTSSTDDG